MGRLGVKRGPPLAAFFWSVAAAAHGLVRTVFGFSVARLGLGLAEGGNFPAAIKTVGEWFPVRERALATSIFNSASNIGAIVCPLSVPWLAIHFGWPAAFYITGALGLVWVVAWVLIYDAPATHPRLSGTERAYIAAGLAEPASVLPSPSWPSLLRLCATWAYMIATLLTSPSGGYTCSGCRISCTSTFTCRPCRAASGSGSSTRWRSSAASARAGWRRA